MTHTQNPGSISDLTAQHFKKLLEEKSNGRITVDIFFKLWIIWWRFNKSY